MSTINTIAGIAAGALAVSIGGLWWGRDRIAVPAWVVAMGLIVACIALESIVLT